MIRDEDLRIGIDYSEGQKDVADFLGLEDDEDIKLIKRDTYEQVQALLNLV